MPWSTDIHANSYSVKDDMIPAFAAALGSEGLRALQRRLKDDLDAQAAGRDTHDSNRRRIAGWLKQIADGLGNVDEYIAIVKSEHQEGTQAVPVARRLFAAGRLQEALAYVEKCTSRRAFSESSDYPKLKSQILAALGRKDEAREILWQEFSDYPSMFRFEPILALIPDEDKAEAHQRAAALAETHRSPEQAARFLVHVNELDRAARLVQQRLGEISGAFCSTVAEVAQALAQSHRILWHSPSLDHTSAVPSSPRGRSASSRMVASPTVSRHSAPATSNRRGWTFTNWIAALSAADRPSSWVALAPPVGSASSLLLPLRLPRPRSRCTPLSNTQS